MGLPEPPGDKVPIHSTLERRNDGEGSNFPLLSDSDLYRGQRSVDVVGDRDLLTPEEAPEGSVVVVLTPGPATEYIRQADLSWVAHGGGGGGGGSDLASIPLGTPTAGFSAGFLTLDAADLGADVIDSINAVLGGIAPSAPGDLTGRVLVLSGTTLFSAKLPSGLPAAWNPFTPGDTIANLIVDNTYVLTAPDAATRFGDGLATDTAGDVVHDEDGSDLNTRDIASGAGATGTIEITDVDSAFNGLFRKVNARINRTQPGEGVITHIIRHDPDSGPSDESLPTVLLFDDVNTAPTFSVIPSLAVLTELTRFLSGIQYYREGTQIDVSYTAASGIFQKAYHPTRVATAQMPSAPDVDRNPGAVPAVLDTFADTASLTLASSNVAAGTETARPDVTVTLRKPDGTQIQSTAALARAINTYATGASTDTRDDFVDEDERLILGTGTAFASTVALAVGEAQVRNGTLVHGADGDYPGHSGDDSHDRRFKNITISGGTLEVAGVTAADIDPFGTGDLNVLFQLETEGVWFDLGLSFGVNNGDGSGSSPANSKGAKISASGGDLAFSLGTFSTGNNGNQLRARVTFRGDNALGMTSMELT